jgi:hypothetical protein
VLKGFLPEAASLHPVELFAVAAMHRACWRCQEGHGVWREWREDYDCAEWTHGTDTLSSGVIISPESCDAAAIHETLYEWRGEEWADKI